MIINPKKILDEKIVTSMPDCSSIEDNQLQQAGIDIRLNKVLTVHTPIIRIGKNTKPDFKSIYLDLNQDSEGYVRLSPGNAYSVDSMEYCKVPEDMVAFVIHRSTFNRSGIFVTGSVYDPGFEGNIAGTMYVHNETEVEIGTRFAQIVFMKAEAASLYNGSYQKQKSHTGEK